jgi:hypothetical protein
MRCKCTSSTSAFLDIFAPLKVMTHYDPFSAPAEVLCFREETASPETCEKGMAATGPGKVLKKLDGNHAHFANGS